MHIIDNKEAVYSIKVMLRQHTGHFASAIVEITWVSYISNDIGVFIPQPQVLFSHNFSTIFMTVNPVLHAHTKHIEIDNHLRWEKSCSWISHYLVCKVLKPSC